MSYFRDQKFTYVFLPNTTINLSTTSAVDSSQEIKIMETKYKKHTGN